MHMQTHQHRDRETPTEFADKLKQYGMPAKQAEVYAYRHAFNNTNSEVAEQLGKDESTVTNQYDTAIEHVSDAHAVTHLARNPKYLTQLPDEIGSLTYNQIDSPVHIRLHRPRKAANHKDYEYTLTYSEVIEIYRVTTQHKSNTDNYLVVYNYYKEFKNTGERTYFTLGKQFITRFLLDWVLPNRHSELRNGTDEKYASKWFLTDVFDCPTIKEQLSEYDTKPVSVFTDKRFEPPTGEHIQLTSGARTGTTGLGYRPAYTPTKQEIQTAETNNDITSNTAKEIRTKIQR